MPRRGLPIVEPGHHRGGLCHTTHNPMLSCACAASARHLTVPKITPSTGKPPH
jgi:hypothetical protein